MDNTVEQDQEHEVYGGDIPEIDTDFEMHGDDESEDVENNNSKDLEESVEIEVEAGALREMQAKVEKEMGSAQDFKENQELKKTNGEGKWKLIIPGLEDAYFAATTYSKDCTLILTQGKCAKTLAMYGLSVVGQDYYGVFPLNSSNLFNVRNANKKKMLNSAEFQNIKKILGLEFEKSYENVKELRYGRLMIMADQDNDGSVFKGLLINFLHFFWPSLLKVPNFLVDFIPPIVVAFTKETSIEKFYSMADYEVWKNELGNKATKYQIKYCKGLACHETEEVKEYFADLKSFTKNFVWVDYEDGYAIELVFGKRTLGSRQFWIQAHQAGYSNIRYRDFIYKELVVFSNQTSIPSIVDGLNLGQRKILFCAFKKRIIEPIRVSEFSGYVSVQSAYHHDDTRLDKTIISMAQNSVSKNKIFLLQQNVQDHSGAKYIQLSPITRYIFHEADEHLLNYLNDDGQFIEPAWFLPIIPIVLVNGSNGEGIGWSTSIPEYNPRDIIVNLLRLLNGEEMVPMIPWSKSGDTTRKSTFSTANMHLLDENGVVKKYYTPEQILKEFFDFRLQFYEKRMTGRLCELNKVIKRLEYKVKYIRLVHSGSIKLGYETLVELLEELEKHGLEKETKVEEEVAAGEEKPQGNVSKTVAAAGYHYLLSMDGLSFSSEKIAELENERQHNQYEYDVLDKENSNFLWKRDLLALAEQLDLDVRNETNEAPKKAPAKRTAARPLPRRVIKRQRWMTTIRHGF